MPATPVLNLPYPVGTDLVVDGDDSIQALAEAVETVILGLVPTGSMMLWTSGTIPDGFLLADGAAVSRTTYGNLFAAIGTTYGAGDGSTTFNLPNMKGRVPVGRDSAQTAFDVLGEVGGAMTAPHTHTASVTVPAQNTGGPSATLSVGSGGGTAGNAAHFHTTGAVTANGTAASSAPSNLQPYVTVNYVIRA